MRKTDSDANERVYHSGVVVQGPLHGHMLVAPTEVVDVLDSGKSLRYRWRDGRWNYEGERTNAVPLE